MACQNPSEVLAGTVGDYRLSITKFVEKCKEMNLL
jgi:hypothetical protein